MVLMAPWHPKDHSAKSRTWVIPEVWKGSLNHSSQQEAQALGLKISAISVWFCDPEVVQTPFQASLGHCPELTARLAAKQILLVCFDPDFGNHQARKQGP